MHIHSNPANPNAQLDFMHAAQKAAGKREAERTRKRLVELASELASEADEEACIVQLGKAPVEEREDAQDKRRNRDQKENAAGRAKNFMSDWA
jgi:hypothetical protein